MMPRYRAPTISAFLSLTPREREVLSAIADGLTDEELARQFTRSAACIRMHLKALRTKLKQSCRAHLVRVAIEAQMVQSAPTTPPARPSLGSSARPTTPQARPTQRATPRAPSPWGR